MEPSERLAALQRKLASTEEPSKRFKLGLRIDKLRALMDGSSPTAATTAATKARPVPPPPSSTFSSIGGLRLTPAELAKRSERASRFEKDRRNGGSGGERLTLREARLRSETRKPPSSSRKAAPPPAAVGENTSLEKPYLRLTSLPAVEDVRPPAVLAAALARLKQKWKDEADGGRPSSSPTPSSAASASARRKALYDSYFREQLKSVRQDLVVQGVRGELAIESYEAHARVALRSGDLAEFNQCQTALLGDLYRDFEGAEGGEGGRRGKERERKEKRASDGGGGAPAPRRPRPPLHPCLRNRPEFASYRILYAQALALSEAGRARDGGGGGGGAPSAVPAALQGVRREDRRHPLVLRALRCASLARDGRSRELSDELRAERGDGGEEGERLCFASFAPLLVPRARASAARSLVAAWRGGAGGSSGGVSVPLVDAARLLGCRSDDDDEGGLPSAAEAFRGAGASVDVGLGIVSVLSSSSQARRNDGNATSALLSSSKAKEKEKEKEKRKKRRESGSSDDEGEERARRKQEEKKKKRKK